MARLAPFAFRAGAGLARRVPAPVAFGVGRVLARAAVAGDAERRRQVERNLRRAAPGLEGPALRAAVHETFASYARYWVEAFRLPGTAPEVIDRHFTHEGFHHILDARVAGTGAIVALPHLGGWEWAGFWLARVQHVPVTVVVERLEPPELFEWFVRLRRSFGFEVVPLGPDVGSVAVRALRENRVLCLLSDRDLTGTGVEVDFFGERTTLPGGPATLALRTGAPILPTAAYFRGRGHHGVVLPPVDLTRRGRLRDDVARITQDVAHHLEDLIREAPEQWHLLQPNWPSDR